MKKIFYMLGLLAMGTVSLGSVVHGATTSNLLATSQGNFTDWNTNAGTKINAVTIADGDDFFIRQTDGNNVQTFTVGNAGVPVGSIINSVTLYVRAKGIDSGSKNFTLGVENGGTFNGGTVISAAGSYTTYSRVMSLNPLTASAWTETEVNNRTTKFGVKRTNSVGNVYITYLYVVVDYTPCVSTTEVCDGLDNDCDAIVDEDIEPIITSCSAGLGECFAKGTITSSCVEGVMTEGECTAIAGDPTDEVCDGLDNDCDATTDEDIAPIVYDCSTGVGACFAEGTITSSCVEGEMTEGECNAIAGDPTDEVCNELDDDCDDSVDEDDVCIIDEEPKECFSATLNVNGKAPRTVMFDALPKTYKYNQNRRVTISSQDVDTFLFLYDVVPNPKSPRRAKGSLVMNGPASFTNLSPVSIEENDTATLSDPTTINFDLYVKPANDAFTFDVTVNDSDNDGIDDCKDMCPKEGGRVNEAGCTVVVCVPTTEVCNGLDDDCDELIDEDTTVVQSCSAGIGACFAEGTITTTCVEGILQAGECTAIAGTPSEEVCDDIDNDCDESIDEGDVCGGGDDDACTETSEPSVISIPATTTTTSPVNAGSVSVGDLLSLSVAGDDTWSAGESDDPFDRESNANGLDAYELYGEFKYGSLVGRINGGAWFSVGTEYDTTVAEAGTLELAYWDSSYEDNSGEVSVTVTREYEVECPAECGDGKVNKEGEECDDGNKENGDGCDSICQTESYCGDGYVDLEAGEECDDGEMYTKLSEEQSSYCNDTCQLVAFPTCGDGKVNKEGEECDDGNENNTDSCSNTCQIRNTGGSASSIGGGNGGPSTLLETGPEKDAGSAPVPATEKSVIQACEEDTYILERLKKLSRQSMEIIEVIPARYARKLGTKALKLSTHLTQMLRKTDDKETRNEIIRAFVCKIEMLKEARGLKHAHIGVGSGGDDFDYLLQYLQDKAVIQFVK